MFTSVRTGSGTGSTGSTGRVPGRAGAAVLTAVVLAACGGSDSGDLSSGGANSDEQAPEGLTSITVADTAGTPSAFIAYGVAQGFFEAEGLDVDLQPSVGGATVIPSLINGEIDVAGSNVVSAILAIDRGLDLKMVTAGSAASEEADNDFSSILVRADSPITDVADLAGTEIAVNTLQNISEIVILGALDKAGVDTSDVEPVEMPFTNMVPAIQRGDVDAGLLIEPFATVGVSQGLRPVLRPYTSLRPGLQIGTYLMTSEHVESDPELVTAFQNAVQRTADSIREDPGSFRDALPDIANIDAALTDEVDLSEWQGRSDRESLELLADLMRQFGLMDGEFDYDSVVLR